jgi:uracil-DNA glycosylase
MRVVLVAEAYGRREAQFQHALVGPSGRELTLEMAIAGFAPYMTLLCRKCSKTSQFIDGFCEHCREYIWPNEFDLIAHWKRLKEILGFHVTNVFNFQPPSICSNCGALGSAIRFGTAPKCKDCGSKEIRENDLSSLFGTEIETPLVGWRAPKRTGSHLKREYFFHIERLWKELKSLNPNLVVALGNCPCWAILDQPGITAARGTISTSERLGFKVLPTFHPAAVLRNTALRATCIADFQKAAREAEFPEIRRQERWIEIIDPTEEGIRRGYEWFKKPARAYANDIETHKRQITIVGFARSVDDALVIPLRVEPPRAKLKNSDGKLVANPNYEAELLSFEPNYWPTPELEAKAWKLIQHGLQTPQPKIFQNGLYDMSYELLLGLQPVNAIHDTMLWHHSLYPELPKSLGFLGSIYCAEIAWKSMRRGETLKRDE